jgi:type IV secretion system protein VirD4
MKIKMNNAVGPQVRTAKPKPSKLLPAAGRGLDGRRPAGRDAVLRPHVQLPPDPGPHIGHVYAPWSILEWSYKWYSQYPDEIMKAGSMGMLVSTVGLLGVAVAKVVTSNSSKANEYLHGSARWAEKKDIQAAGLLPRERNVLESRHRQGRTHGYRRLCRRLGGQGRQFHYLRHNGPEHVLTYAPTRSGKGVGLVVPTLLSWPASAVITDLKGELWALTAGWRQKHAKNKVLRFEPASAPAAASAGTRWMKSALAPKTKWATCRTCDLDR